MADREIGHRRAEKVALVVDLENISFTCAGMGIAFSPATLMVMARELGEVIYATAFIDAQSLSTQDRIHLFKSGVTVVDCPRLSRGKDTVDPKIIEYCNGTLIVARSKTDAIRLPQLFSC
ncbi:hypothetical protein COY93_00330 [Candidatus Uhrbacteria bacterium CG_4_10_14_0_8_um_filter_58_22]|uniref:NYN domain-containing protein n=1 Tax=Candidatus Uhrbacteria bacterium CG_4_10_14_0_8_um_filter_58_22 TaxID=1975029 RepID=A0A2M7QBV3_9BACT|nr:MAG: hypothetical protein AUJ19_03185 [Parcubacteria group bacterium CG1_02_58_44]PIY63350.1 MAG: hypothetical protein COY93_00330 [Candidatus Uhrbacteria bacterium CG_4_10_14_0_8_um_filter_58_22]